MLGLQCVRGRQLDRHRLIAGISGEFQEGMRQNKAITRVGDRSWVEEAGLDMRKKNTLSP